MVAAGRVMVLFRELPLNTRREYVDWLEEGVHSYSSQLTPDLQEGVLGTSVMKMHILELETNKGPADAFELALHFWSWGDTDDEVFSNLYTVINNIHATLRALATDVSERRYLRAAPEGLS